jgi:hypothetical protein
MILRPTADHSSSSEPHAGKRAVPIWNAIQATQMEKPSWCITQIDHARLSGEIAERAAAEMFPGFDERLVQAISLHDEGWHELDAASPVRSFLDVPPQDFLRAWRASIEAARKVSELGGVMVGGHFYRLGKARLELAANTPKDAHLLQEFLGAQEHLRRQWQGQAPQSAEQLEELIDFLQFCDVFSLYLCCGAQERVEFPQKLGGTIFQLYREDEWCVSSPPLFEASFRPKLRAREVNKGTKGKAAEFNFQLR